jgi:hypothetical protein
MKLRIAKTEHKFFVVDEHLNRSTFQRLDVIVNQLCYNTKIQRAEPPLY